MFKFSEEQIERYSRQIILPQVGGRGQRKIRQASVLIVGAGGLGSPCAFYLGAAGVGKIGLVDSDEVELSNLSRQILHFSPDVGREKVYSAKEKLNKLNPDVEVVAYSEKVSSENIMSLINDYDIVVDGSDNFPTRYLVNDACVMTNKPLSHGAILQFNGQIFTILPGKGPCYRCLFAEPPPPGEIPNCQQAGVIGAVAGVVGAIQANEVLKIILNQGKLLVGHLLIIDLLGMEFRKVKISKNKDCAMCGDSPSIKNLIDYEQFCGIRR
ncbi:molybdopterin-synthase adenylyltransferase MoeB [Candidatus Aerophobetes bacterium]|nr:molybdopterin-synthase adenylyltransferase MoeB [Candidatus Aerophobetes bacterium]